MHRQLPLPPIRSTAPLLGCAGLIFLFVGCGVIGGAPDVVPSTETARQNLEEALDSWKANKPLGKETAAAPASRIYDSVRESGQKLAEYEILGEEPGQGSKKFKVRLRLTNPKLEQEVNYIVLGKDPVMVYREDDYMKSMNMDTPPPTPGGRRPS